MNSRERLMRTFRGEEVDRVPISLYEFDGFYDDWIYDYPEYVEILKYAEGKTDKMYFWSPKAEAGEEILFYGVIDKSRVKRLEWRNGSSNYVRTVIETPRGTLTTVRKQTEGVHTSWTLSLIHI